MRSHLDPLRRATCMRASIHTCFARHHISRGSKIYATIVKNCWLRLLHHELNLPRLSNPPQR